MSNFINFTAGDKVEIIKTSSTNFATTFYPATIILREINQPNKRKKRKKNNNYHDHDDYDDEFEDEEEAFMVQYKTQFNDIVTFVERADIRPVPPEDVGDGGVFDVGDKVDVFSDGCWMKGMILGILYEGLRFIVEIEGDYDVPIEVGRSCLRVHRDWCNGSWIPPFDHHVQKDSLKMEKDVVPKPGTVAAVRTDANGKRVRVVFKRAKGVEEAKFSPGIAVEVKSDEGGYQGSWYAAIVVGSAGVGKFLVEYRTLKTEDESDLLKEVANEQDIRPCPPEISHSNRYKEFEEVDAWYNDGWWEGVIYEVLDGWKYIVYFATTKEKLIFQHPNLRPHQNWVEGKWSSAFMKSIEEKRFDAEKPPQEVFREGILVEVRSDEDGYQGSWYAATIIKLIAKDKFLVEYDSLKTKYESQPVREEVPAADVRPLPPRTMHIGRYKCLEEVDAWWAGGWWVGEVSNVLNRKKYVVHFASTGDKREFDHGSLRSHQDWIHGRWITSKHPSSDLKLKNSSTERKYTQSETERSFSRGTMVEVKSDEPGYEGSWYSAVIVSSTRKGRFLVEYLTLKSEDERNFLREEVGAQNIRPSPPDIEVDGCYYLLEKVNAWYNDGWWAGVISKLLNSLKYMVYFEATKEELEFDHINLRTHQEWINGKWIVTAIKDTGFLTEMLFQRDRL